MILLCGIPTEGPMELVAEALERQGREYLVFNQRHFREARLELEVGDGALGGVLQLGRRVLPLTEVRAVYVRLMDDGRLPELRSLPRHSGMRQACRALHESLSTWLEMTPARVVNRGIAQYSNSAKPYQAQLIQAAGFQIPETLVTSDPEAVRDFRAQHGRIVFKSASGTRSIVREVDDRDIGRLDLIRWCPVQFQRLLPGHDVRVHCVGEAVFATAIESSEVDYRYAGDSTSLHAIDVSDEVADRALRLTASLSLEFSGIDLRFGSDGEVWCFEVNPSPGFSFYEQATGQPIAAAVAGHLAAA